MKYYFAIVVALLLCATACISPAWARTDVLVAVDNAANLGVDYAGPQLLHYTYDSTALAYSLDGHASLPAGSTVNSIAMTSTEGSSGGIYASVVGSTNELREYSWNQATNTFSNLRSVAGMHSELVVGSDNKLYGFNSTTGNLNFYTPSGATFNISGFQNITDVGGTQSLAAHPTNGSIFSGGLKAVTGDPADPARMTRISQWSTGLGSEVGYYPAGVLAAHKLSVTKSLSPLTGQPMLWMNNDTSVSPFPAYKVWTFDTPLTPDGVSTASDATNYTILDSMDNMSDGTMLATGYFPFSQISDGLDGSYIWAIEGGTDGVLNNAHDPNGIGPTHEDKIHCEAGSETTTGCIRIVTESATEKPLLSVDNEDTIHVLGVGLIGGYKYSSMAPDELGDISVVAAIHAIGTLGNGTAIATATAPPLPVVAGDYNKNLVVDAGDYVVWRAMQGQSVAPGTGADGTGPGNVPDGFVDNLDYDFWKERFGNIPPPASSAALGATVPEPTTAWLFVLGAACLFRLKGRA